MRFLSRSICSSFNGGKARRRQNEIRGAISLVHRLIQRFSFVLLLLEGCVLEILFRPLRDRALVSSLRHPETLDAIAALRKARILSYSRRKERICCPNTSADATCDELVCRQTIYAMKKGMILSAALSVVGLMLVSCAGEPEATTTTTRQTTVTAPPPVPASRTTTTTTHTGGY